MSWEPNPYTPLFFVGGLLSSALALYGWRRRRAVPGAAFASLMLAVGFWSIAYGVELASSGLRAKLFWANVQYLGIVAVPASWLVFALENSGYGHRVTSRVLALLTVEPLITLILAWTSDAHRLFRIENRLEPAGPSSFLVSEKGPAFWVHSAYSYVLLLAGTLFILRSARALPRLRSQAVTLVGAALLPWVANGVYLSGASPLGPLDLSPVGFVLTGLLMAAGLSRFSLLDLVPVARELVLEEIGDGIIVVDADGRVVDVNPAAAELLEVAAADAFGRPLEQALPAAAALLEQGAPSGGGEIVRGEGKAARHFEVRASPLKTGRGRLWGRVITIRDVSAHRSAEEAARRHSEYLESLHQTALGLMDRLELGALLETLVTRATGLLEAPNGFLYLESADASFLECRVWVGSRPMDKTAAAGEGAVGTAWQTGRALTVEDYDTWSGRSTQVAQGIFGSMAAVPLRRSGRVCGALGVAHDAGSRKGIGEAELRLLSGFAQLASIALDNAQLFQAEHTARERAERLQAATHALSGTVDPKTVFGLILRELERVLPSDTASIQTLAGTRLEVVGGRGAAEGFIGHSFDISEGDGRSAEVLERREAVIKTVPHVDGAFAGGIPKGFRSWMGVPLLFGSRPIGLLVLNKNEPDFYTREHASLASAFADQASIAIESARLYASIQESEARYRQLVENASDIIYRTDAQGRFTYANPVGLKLMARSAEEVIGKSYTELIRPDYREAAASFFVKQFKERLPTTYFEFPAIAKDGREVWLGQNVQLLLEGDRVLGFEAVVRDITERKRTEDELRASEERFRQLAENIDAVFWMRAVEPPRFLYLSPSFERIWGRPSADMLSRGPLALADTIHPEDRDVVRSRLTQAEGYDLEYRILRPDGAVRWIRTRAFPVRDQDGVVRRIAGIAEDVSDRKALETMRDDLTRTMVHDLRSPLSVVQGTLEYLEDAKLSATQREILEAGQRTAGKLLGLVNQILDVSRLEQGAMPLDRTRVDLASLASEALALAAPLAESKGLRLEKEIAASLPPAWVDAGLVERVLQNLVGNAVNFTPDGGSVHVGVTASEKDPAMLRVAVSDTGLGVPDEVQRRLFQKFASGPQAGHGSGLGLAFCRLAIEAHGGRIWLESKVGGGARFLFTLPAAAG